MLYSDKVSLMVEFSSEIWNTTQTSQLTQVLVSINDASIMQNFLRDVLTESEITEISARLEAARLLTSKTTYTEITQATKLSSRTIARISGWMQNGTGGYAAALTLTNHHGHTTRSGAA